MGLKVWMRKGHDFCQIQVLINMSVLSSSRRGGNGLVILSRSVFHYIREH